MFDFNGAELHLISIQSILSVIIAGFIIGKIYVYRTGIPQEVAKYRIYTMGVLNAAFAVLLYFSHNLSQGYFLDPDDRFLWLEAIALNAVFLTCVYFGQRKRRG